MYTKNRASISLCMIVLNEEKCLRRSLSNVSPFVDEIIVVDGGSTDKTIDIATQFGAHVILSPWQEDFAKQRNVSLKHATKDWILIIDADEVYEKKMLEALQKLADNNIEADIFTFPRKNYIDGKLTSDYPDSQFRFFKNNKKIRFERKVHEVATGFKRMVSIMDLHIIHRKTSARQAIQNKHYEAIQKTIIAK